MKIIGVMIDSGFCFMYGVVRDFRGGIMHAWYGGREYNKGDGA